MKIFRLSRQERKVLKEVKKYIKENDILEKIKKENEIGGRQIKLDML